MSVFNIVRIGRNRPNRQAGGRLAGRQVGRQAGRQTPTKCCAHAPSVNVWTRTWTHGQQMLIVYSEPDAACRTDAATRHFSQPPAGLGTNIIELLSYMN